jgi:hypothetical protein
MQSWGRRVIVEQGQAGIYHPDLRCFRREPAWPSCMYSVHYATSERNWPWWRMLHDIVNIPVNWIYVQIRQKHLLIDRQPTGAYLFQDTTAVLDAV